MCVCIGRHTGVFPGLGVGLRSAIPAVAVNIKTSLVSVNECYQKDKEDS